MTQTRVFVTYLPARSTPGRATARSVGSLGAPAATVLASAIFAGGLVHALGSAGVVTHRDARVAFDVAPDVPKGVSAEAVPLLAMASTGMAPTVDLSAARSARPPAQSAQRPTQRMPEEAPAVKAATHVASPLPTAGKRLDLEGFLDEQGYALVAAPAEETSSLAESPVAFAPAAELAPGEGAITAPAHPTLPAPQAEAQTFPTVTVDGMALGAVTMRGDTVHLSSLVGLLELKMSAEEFTRLQAAPASDSFVSIDTLRAAGLDVAIAADGESLALAAR